MTVKYNTLPMNHQMSRIWRVNVKTSHSRAARLPARWRTPTVYVPETYPTSSDRDRVPNAADRRKLPGTDGPGRRDRSDKSCFNYYSLQVIKLQKYKRMFLRIIMQHGTNKTMTSNRHVKCEGMGVSTAPYRQDEAFTGDGSWNFWLNPRDLQVYKRL